VAEALRPTRHPARLCDSDGPRAASRADASLPLRPLAQTCPPRAATACGSAATSARSSAFRPPSSLSTAADLRPTVPTREFASHGVDQKAISGASGVRSHRPGRGTTAAAGLRVHPRRAQEAGGHAGATPPRVSGAVPGRLSIYAVLRALPGVVGEARLHHAPGAPPARSSTSTTPERNRTWWTRRPAR
jgi:hypothetical protein